MSLLECWSRKHLFTKVNNEYDAMLIPRSIDMLFLQGQSSLFKVMLFTTVNKCFPKSTLIKQFTKFNKCCPVSPRSTHMLFLQGRSAKLRLRC